MSCFLALSMSGTFLFSAQAATLSSGKMSLASCRRLPRNSTSLGIRFWAADIAAMPWASCRSAMRPALSALSAITAPMLLSNSSRWRLFSPLSSAIAAVSSAVSAATAAACTASLASLAATRAARAAISAAAGGSTIAAAGATAAAAAALGGMSMNWSETGLSYLTNCR